MRLRSTGTRALPGPQQAFFELGCCRSSTNASDPLRLPWLKESVFRAEDGAGRCVDPEHRPDRRSAGRSGQALGGAQHAACRQKAPCT